MNGTVSKTVVGFMAYRGFESHPLRVLFYVGTIRFAADAQV